MCQTGSKHFVDIISFDSHNPVQMFLSQFY